MSAIGSGSGLSSCSSSKGVQVSGKFEIFDHTNHYAQTKAMLTDAIFRRCIEGKDICELFVNDSEQPAGCIVYHREVSSSRSLHLKACSALSSSSTDQSEETVMKQLLLERAIQIAKHACAPRVTVTVEKVAILRNVLVKNHFRNRVSLDNVMDLSLRETSRTSRRAMKREGDLHGIREYEQKRRKTLERPSTTGSSSAGSSTACKTHKFPMRGTIYFDYIMSGKKKFEGRVNGPGCRRMQVGDHLRLFDNRAHWGILCEITSLDTYDTFHDMLQAKGVLVLLPQLENIAKQRTQSELLDHAVRTYQAFPGSQRCQQFGAVAIGVKYIEKIDQN